MGEGNCPGRDPNLVVLGDVVVGGVSDALHHGLEAELRVGRVLHDALGAVRLVQRVHSLDGVAIGVLPGLLVVTGVVVLDAVLELVRDRSLSEVGRERGRGRGSESENGRDFLFDVKNCAASALRPLSLSIAAGASRVRVRRQ